MNEFSFLRRPMKVILYSVLLILMTTASLIFILQYALDGIAMENFVDNYAYVATVYSREAEKPFLKEVSGEIIAELSASDNVECLDVRKTYSARAEGLWNVPDRFIAICSLNNVCFVEGIVKKRPELDDDSGGRTEYLEVTIIKTWAGNTGEYKELLLRLIRDDGETEAILEEGDHIFFTGNYSMAADNAASGSLFRYQQEKMANDMGSDWERSIVQGNNSLIILPKELSEEEAEAYIIEKMKETGLYKSYERTKELQDVFSVRAVSDMSLLLTNVDGSIFLTEGRELNEYDIGTKVCVIHQAVADANDLALGDTVSLALADGCYVINETYEPNAGWESAYPGEMTETLLEYGEPCEYEIVGIYSNIQRSISSDYFMFSKNDIFIPAGNAGTTENSETKLDADIQNARPYAFSFRVLGPDYESFMDEFEVALFERGYVIYIVDAGWEDVQDAYYSMESRRGFMLACALVAFLAAILSFDCLIVYHFRYEYGLCRLLGAYEKEARRIFYAGFAATAVPAGLLSAMAAFLTYELGLKEQTAAYIPETVFGSGDCALLLAAGVAAELVAAFAVLYIMIMRMKRSSVLKLLR